MESKTLTDTDYSGVRYCALHHSTTRSKESKMKRIPILVDKKYSGHWFDQKKAIRFDSNLSGMDSLSDFHEAMYLTKSNTWIWNEFTFGNDGDVDSDKYFKSDENFASKWLTRHRVDIQNYEEVPQTVKDSIEKIVSKMEV